MFRGQGIAFREVRPYQPGDDVRQIDWNRTACMGEAFVKIFTEEREMTVMLVVDVSASEQFGTARDEGARRGRGRGVARVLGDQGGDRVGLVMVSDRVERIVLPRKGEKHVMRVTREVLGAEPTGRKTDLARARDAHPRRQATERCVSHL